MMMLGKNKYVAYKKYAICMYTYIYLIKFSAAAFSLCPRLGTASPKGGNGNKWGRNFNCLCTINNV
jgi:hypothetical protein